jgi:sterol 14alpha-demethylase
MDPTVWKDPAKWEPGRWMRSENGAGAARQDELSGEKVDYGYGMVYKGTGSPYQPFGAGRHRCIGEKFAFAQEGSIIATVIRNLELRLPAGQAIPPHNYHVGFQSEATGISPLILSIEHDRHAEITL